MLKNNSFSAQPPTPPPAQGRRGPAPSPFHLPSWLQETKAKASRGTAVIPVHGASLMLDTWGGLSPCIPTCAAPPSFPSFLNSLQVPSLATHKGLQRQGTLEKSARYFQGSPTWSKPCHHSSTHWQLPVQSLPQAHSQGIKPPCVKPTQACSQCSDKIRGSSSSWGHPLINHN